MAARTIDAPDKEYMDITEVCKFVGLSENTVRRLMRDGEFPRPLNPSGHTGPRAARLWHWRSLVYWTLRVEMRPYLRVSKPKKKETPITATNRHTRSSKSQLADESS